MEENDNILTGYCFLAALTENQNDLFNHVFVPICKRTLSLYSLQGATHGRASDIKDLISKEYGIDIPIVMVKRLINASSKSLSNRSRQKLNFNVFQNGETFEIQKFAFDDLEIQYKKGVRNAQALQNAFIHYLNFESINKDDVPSFTDFLEKNKKHLASFFKGTADINGKFIDKTFIYHVQFLEYIETGNHELFEIAKGLYLGSIVASFLEAGLDIEPKFDPNEIYYLDTPIVLRALNLQKEEDTEPITEMLDLIKNTGGQLRVLSITVDEIFQVIENAIGNYHSSIPTTTINEACLRNGKNRAWLMTYNAKLEENILDNLKAKKIDLTSSFIEKNKKSADIKALQDERVRKGNALHDVLAYLFVRDARGGSVTLFQKAKIWFLTSNSSLLKFNKSHNQQKSISEIVLPDALTSLLWLKDPSKLLAKVKKIGLSELMASTLNEEIASKELINEFEANINKLEGITQDDYRTLLESVAHQSAKKIEHFNEIVNQDTEKAKIEAHKIIEAEKTRKASRIKAVKDAQSAKAEEEEKNKILSDKLNKIELDLATAIDGSTSSNTQIEELSIKLERQGKLINSIFIVIALVIIISLIIAVFYLNETLTNKNRILIYIGITIATVGFSFTGFYLYKNISKISKILNWIMAAGGIWSLLNLILNVFKSIMDK